MTTTGSTSTRETPLGRDILHAVRYYFRGWRGPAALAGIVAIAGVAFGWSWLVAAGIAPLLLSVLPCVAMCALGLCMNRLTGRQCSTDTASQKVIAPVDADEPTDARLGRNHEALAEDACGSVPQGKSTASSESYTS